MKKLTTKEILNALILIQKMKNENTIDAWEDNLEETRTVVMLENFSRKPQGENYKYNGWAEKLSALIKKLWEENHAD